MDNDSTPSRPPTEASLGEFPLLGSGSDLTVEMFGLTFSVLDAPAQSSPGMATIVVSRSVDETVLDRFEVSKPVSPTSFLTAVSNWTADRLGAIPPSETLCVSCSVPLQPVFDTDTGFQFEDALSVALDGGYGMFFDPVGVSPPPVLLCGDCARELCAQHPWIKDIIDTTSSL